MDHLRGAHNVPWEVKSACLEKFLPPWTVVVGFFVCSALRDLDGCATV